LAFFVLLEFRRLIEIRKMRNANWEIDPCPSLFDFAERGQFLTDANGEFSKGERTCIDALELVSWHCWL
jgi:hypothetical protein